MAAAMTASSCTGSFTGTCRTIANRGDVIVAEYVVIAQHISDEVTIKQGSLAIRANLVQYSIHCPCTATPDPRGDATALNSGVRRSSYRRYSRESASLLLTYVAPQILSEQFVPTSTARH